jgi:transposase-like protein
MNIDEIYRRFPTHIDCVAYLEDIRWNGLPSCPYCTSNRSTPVNNQQRYHCNACNTPYSVTVSTVFHQTHLPLQKWFLAIGLLLNPGASISARQIAQQLSINKNTACSLVKRVDVALRNPNQRELLHIIADMFYGLSTTAHKE